MRNTVELGVKEISSWIEQKLKANFALAPINQWALWTSFNHFFPGEGSHRSRWHNSSTHLFQPLKPFVIICYIRDTISSLKRTGLNLFTRAGCCIWDFAHYVARKQAARTDNPATNDQLVASECEKEKEPNLTMSKHTHEFLEKWDFGRGPPTDIPAPTKVLPEVSIWHQTQCHYWWP